MLSVLGGPHSPRYWGARAFAPLCKFISDTTEHLISDSTIDTELVSATRQAAARVRFPGICVVISDFLYPHDTLHRMLAPLRARNMEIHAVQVLGTGDQAPLGAHGGVVLLDSETGVSRGVEVTRTTAERYESLLREHNTLVRQFCLSAQISFTQAASSLDVSPEKCALTTISRMGLFV